MANIALSNGKFIEVDSDDDVDYELATEDRLFGSHINAIPIQSAVQGPRLFYGARFENQALPLKDAEVPLVQNQDMDTGLSFDKLYGKYAGAVEADDDFTVDKVDPDQIVLRNKNGEKVIKELYNNTPFNRKTSIHNTPLVKPGDAVARGQILAKSNYTDDNGTLAMGKNALVGLVAYKGHSMDDAIAISESFAGKLTSEHSETHELQLDPNTKINKNHFRSLFPENYKKEQLEKVDDDGVITRGMILKQGDPIFLSTKPRTINSSSFTSGKLTKGLAQAREDTSLKWDYPYDAEVVDVYKGRKGIKVLTKAYAPAQKGDKIVFRSGQKSFHKDTEVFTNRGWVLISELKNDDLVFSLFNSSGTYHSEFTPVIDAHSYKFEGQLYTMDSDNAAYAVTAGHRVFCNFNKSWKIMPALEVHEKNYKFLSDGSVPLSIGVSHLEPDVTSQIKFERLDYSDMVYCIQVRGLGVILTRFNGKQVWIGNSIISEIIPDEQMPKTESGETLEVLLNQLGLPSRINTSLPYELALGKVAHKEGNPIILPGFTKKGEKWRDIVNNRLKEAGVEFKERIYDPKEDRFLEDPIAVGRGYIMKLHHTATSKVSARGQGSYDQYQQPTKGGGEGAQAKRLSGLETTVMLSSGAYNNIREASILRGQQNDEFWRQLKMGLNPKPPGVPFVWDKFNKMLMGAGINPKQEGKGQIRLTPMTDAVLDSYRPLELKNADIVDMRDLSPKPGGLFDPALVSANAWGKITLPKPLPNPAYEKSIRTLLGLKKAEFEEIIKGEKPLRFKKKKQNQQQ
jgi:DNA-directed RNA polymerase subunit beta